jgi:CHASE2 domain-containing sensor protein
MNARSKRVAGLLAFATALAVGLLVHGFGGFSALERSTLTTRFQVRGTQRPRGVVVVAIDAPSIQRLGNFPWKRRLDAKVIDVLHGDGARQIVFDVQFSTATTAVDDNALIEAIARARNVTLASTVVNDNRGDTPVLGAPSLVRKVHAAVGMGLYAATPQSVFERVPYSVLGLRSLAVVAVSRATGRPVAAAPFHPGGAYIDYRGGPGTFPTFSFADVLAGRVEPSRIRGEVVVVGATAPVLLDLHATPMGGLLMSGPEIHANAIWTIQHGLPLRDASSLVAVLLIVLLSGFAPAARFRARPLTVVAGCVGAAGLYLVIAQLAFNGGTVLPVVAPLLALIAGAVGMIGGSELLEARERRRLQAELYEAQLELIHRLGQAAEWRDSHTGEHLGRIARLTKLLGLAAGMSERHAEMLRHASLMHDIGKVGVPDRILLKEGPLDDDERSVMNSHTSIGGDILGGSASELVQMSEAVARTHHERWDGTGYPVGLSGEEIPIEGRICSICDVFDALVTARTYKPAWSVDDATAELRRLSGTAFDPALLEVFLALVPALPADLLQPSSMPDPDTVAHRREEADAERQPV